jgi:hypothetical protein
LKEEISSTATQQTPAIDGEKGDEKHAPLVTSICVRMAALIDALPLPLANAKGDDGALQPIKALSQMLDTALCRSHHSQHVDVVDDGRRGAARLTPAPLAALGATAKLFSFLDESAAMFVGVDELHVGLQRWLDEPAPLRCDSLSSVRAATSSAARARPVSSANHSAAVAALWAAATSAVVKCYVGDYNNSMVCLCLSVCVRWFQTKSFVAA